MSTPDHGPDESGRPPPFGSPLWPAFAMMAGAGAAFLWWSQWQKSLAAQMPGSDGAPPPADATSAQAPAPAPAPESFAAVPPEEIMEHTPPPARLGSEPVDPSDAQLVEPAAEIMAHAPPETVGVTVESDGHVAPTPIAETQATAPPLPSHDAPPADLSALEPSAPSLQAASLRTAAHEGPFTPHMGDVSAAALAAGTASAETIAAATAQADAAAPTITEALGVQGASGAEAAATVGKPRARRKPEAPGA